MAIPVCRQCLLPFLLLGIAPSIAPGNDASGTHPPGAAAPVQEEQTATQAPSDSEPGRSIARYETRIAELEAAEGPHAAELVEVRQGLGLLHQQAGDHGQAIAVLRDALQSVRVNEGLYSMSQVARAGSYHRQPCRPRRQGRTTPRLRAPVLAVPAQLRRLRNVGLVPVIKSASASGTSTSTTSAHPNTTVEPLIAADDLYAKALEHPPGRHACLRDRAHILYKVAVINHHVAEDMQDPMLSHREIRAAMIPHGRTIPLSERNSSAPVLCRPEFLQGQAFTETASS